MEKVIVNSYEDFEKLAFGLFVHWGLYSQLGAGEWVQSNVSGPLGQVFSRLWGQVTEDSTKTGETVKGIWSGTASSIR